ncbi:hypothetical protein TURU_144136 [Turdus rufiventris]|nr:hypothetical protein TURU_144136 [Turdus rufiventris]
MEYACGVLTLAGFQVPTKVTVPSLLSWTRHHRGTGNEGYTQFIASWLCLSFLYRGKITRTFPLLPQEAALDKLLQPESFPELQFFMNCSSMGLFMECSPSGTHCSSMGFLYSTPETLPLNDGLSLARGSSLDIGSIGHRVVHQASNDSGTLSLGNNAAAPSSHSPPAAHGDRDSKQHKQCMKGTKSD